MWCHRKIMRLSWLEKISNERVLYMVGMERSLLVTIRRGQLQFVGHVVRKEGFEKLVLERNINGKRQRGRQRLKYLEGLALTVLVSDTWRQRQTLTRHLRRRYPICYIKISKRIRDDTSFPSAERPFQVLAPLKEKQFWRVFELSLVVSNLLLSSLNTLGFHGALW